MTSMSRFLESDNVHFDPRGGIHFGESPAQYPALAQSSTVTPLTDRELLEVQGPDAEKLLQGQLTCDITSLEIGASLPGALCDAKGRMIASFVCLRLASDHLILVMAAGLLAQTLEILKKYAVFYKVSLTDVSGDYGVFGLYRCESQTAEPRPDAQLFALDSDRSLLLVPASGAEELWQHLKTVGQAVGTGFWHYLSIQAGLGEVRSETQGEFIPQMLNLQHTGAISFKKGCYTGQEIVARMQYLGKLKRRMYHLRIATAEPLAAGETINCGEKKSVGTLVISEPSEDHLEVLAVLTEEAAAASNLEIGGNPFEITQVPLPYEEQFSKGE